MKQNRLYLFLALAFYAIGGAFNQAMAQIGPLQQTVSGTVTDALGPITGVNVILHNQNNGTFTDQEGQYRIMASPLDTLVFTYLGYKTVKLPVGNRTQINVRLQEEATALQEVEVNAGYYTVKERERTGSISRVTAKEIELQPVSNPLAALQGRMPGVDITQTSGLPGAGFSIQIRGQNSIAAGNDPLYIVNGVPFSSEPINYNQTSGVLGGIISPLNGIDPADIEKVEVLKDADATAIYGSRGANGVVLITTKKGRSGKAKLNIHINSSLGRVTRFMDLLDTPQYLEMRREAFANDGITDYPANAYDVNGTWDQNRYTNWQKELIGGTAQRTQAQASVSGGSAKTRYLLSGNYQMETTVFPGKAQYKKGSVLMNLDHNSDDGRFALNFSGNYVIDQNHLPATDLTRLARTLPPNAPELYTEEGELNWENNTWTNPLRELKNRFLANTHTLIVNSVISYALIKELMVKVNLGYTDSHINDSRTLPSTRFNPAFGYDSSRSVVYRGNSSRTSWIVEPQLRWQHTAGLLQMDLLFGTTYQRQSSDQIGLYGSGFPSNELLDDISAATNININLNSSLEYKYQAIFGRLNLNFDKKYILNLTARRDGSSRFGPGRHFANFGAIGAAWLFSDEDFIKEALPVLSFGKLRGSYGTTGNDQIGDYQFLETYSLGGTNYNGIATLLPSRLFNPNFGWERNDKLEVGLVLGFLKDRLWLSGSYYRNRSSNQLVGIPMPGTTGFNSLQANLGATLQNKGLELEISSQLVHGRKWQWTMAMNMSLPQNKLLAFPGLEASTYANRYVIGESLGISKLYDNTGVDPISGVYQFKDYDNDGSISSPNDKQWIADRDPDFYGGLNNHFTLDNFEVDFLFQFTKQRNWNYVYNGSSPGLMINLPVDVLERWREVGDNAPLQRYTTGQNSGATLAFSRYSSSNKALSDASFFRLKTLSISYNIPSKYSKGMDCRIYIHGQNLWTLTGYHWGDPEFIGVGRLPPLRQITLGTQLSF